MQLLRLSPSRACSLRSPGDLAHLAFVPLKKKKLKSKKSKASNKFLYLQLVVVHLLRTILFDQVGTCINFIFGTRIRPEIRAIAASAFNLSIFWATQRGHTRALVLGNGPVRPRLCRTSGASGTHSLCSFTCPLKYGAGRRLPRCEKPSFLRSRCWKMCPRLFNEVRAEQTVCAFTS